MATGTVVYQSATLATPPANLAVMADAISDSDHGAGTVQYIKIMDGATAGTAKVGATEANGLAVDVTRVQGTIQALGSIQGVGTFQVLGSVRFLDGSVHIANAITGTVQTHGTSQVLGTVQAHGTNQALGTFQPLAGSVHVANAITGTVQTHGTSQVLGTVRFMDGSVHLAAGSVNAQGVIAHGAAIAGNPLSIAGFGSSGTQAAVSDGQLTRLWTDLNGRLWTNVQTFAGTLGGGTVQTHGTSQVLGSVQTVGTSQILGTVQTHGTSQVIGTVQTHGTSQVLGSVRFLDGSVHLAAGSVNAQGVIAHGAAIAGNPLSIAAFGSSGTQAAVSDGQLTRLWADLNGRLWTNVQTFAGTVGGGTVQTHGTNQVLGTVQTHGTSQALGTMQPLAGSVHVANTAAITGTASVQGLVAHDAVGAGNPVYTGGQASRARPGTVAVDDAVRTWYDQQGRQVVQVGAGTTELHGTVFVGAGANGTLLAARGAGSFWRIHDILISGSAAGSIAILQDTGVAFGPLFLAANGGWSFNSAVGVKLSTANSSLVARFTAGTWAININYSLEGM